MKIFSSEDIIDIGFHTRTYARWEFIINNSNMVISGMTYLSRTDSNFTNVFSRWTIPFDLSAIDVLLAALKRGKEWSHIAQNNKVENFTKEINGIGGGISVVFRVRETKSYIYIESGAIQKSYTE